LYRLGFLLRSLNFCSQSEQTTEIISRDFPCFSRSFRYPELSQQRNTALNQEDQMSKFTGKKKSPKFVEPVTAEAPTPKVEASGRTIVEIAKELKLTPQNARRLARKHGDVLGHSGKGSRWLLTPDQEKAFVELATKPVA
jgi:hypothetical protein